MLRDVDGQLQVRLNRRSPFADGHLERGIRAVIRFRLKRADGRQMSPDLRQDVRLIEIDIGDVLQTIIGEGIGL